MMIGEENNGKGHKSTSSDVVAVLQRIPPPTQATSSSILEGARKSEPLPPTTGLRTPDNVNGDNVDTTSQPLSPTIPRALSALRPKIVLSGERWLRQKGVSLAKNEEYLERIKNVRKKMSARWEIGRRMAEAEEREESMPDVVLWQQVSKLSEENSKLREELSVVRESLAEERQRAAEEREKYTATQSDMQKELERIATLVQGFASPVDGGAHH